MLHILLLLRYTEAIFFLYYCFSYQSKFCFCLLLPWILENWFRRIGFFWKKFLPEMLILPSGFSLPDLLRSRIPGTTWSGQSSISRTLRSVLGIGSSDSGFGICPGSRRWCSGSSGCLKCSEREKSINFFKLLVCSN